MATRNNSDAGKKLLTTFIDMKRFYFIIMLLLAAPFIYSQQLSQVSFARGESLTSLGFLTDQGVLIRVSDKGQLIEWGTEEKALRYDVYAPKLRPYAGRVDYYGSEGDSISKGKVKSIGTCVITYYGPFETSEKIGKIKSIGSLAFDYFSQFQNPGFKGRIKQVGSQAFDYYGSFENEAYKEKLKTIGTSTIAYHSSFDDKFVRGKVKNIANVPINWYTSLDPGKMNGALKNGSYRQRIAGITYILQ
jgi:hypothetical protein